MNQQPSQSQSAIQPPRCPIPALLRKAMGIGTGNGTSAEPLLSVALKMQTQQQHDLAEHHPLHAVMFGSQGVDAAREAYRRLLGQHLLIQRAFEPRLAAVAASGAWGELVRKEHMHLSALQQDCDDLCVGEDLQQALPATDRFIRFIEGAGVAAVDDGEGGAGLLGVFYVFEGSTNGGTIIAMRVKDLLGLEGERGTRFINPHGSQVRPRWVEWKNDVDALRLTDVQRAAAIAGAQEAFTLSHAVLNDVAGAMTASIGGKPEMVVLPIKSGAAAKA